MLAWRALMVEPQHGSGLLAHSIARLEVTDKLMIRHLAGRHGVPTADGQNHALRLTHHDLAALIGSCREAVSRGLKALRDRGVIAVRRYITLPGLGDGSGARRCALIGGRGDRHRDRSGDEDPCCATSRAADRKAGPVNRSALAHH